MRPVTRATCWTEPAWRDGFEEVAHHGGVDADVFGFGGLAQPGGDEDVRGLEVGDGAAESGGVEEVGGDEVDAGDVG